MQFLIDGPAKRIRTMQQSHPALVLGQLITPLTGYAYFGDQFGIDNGAFSRFQRERFEAVLSRQAEARDKCLFIACPDVVGSARRTLEAFDFWAPRLEGWPVALVAQDGIEDLPIPWDYIAAIFVGGTTDWKESRAAADVVKTGLILGKHVHIGRVNTPRRYKHFADIGAHTCDGSGVSRYSWMLEKIAADDFADTPLLDLCGTDN